MWPECLHGKTFCTLQGAALSVATYALQRLNCVSSMRHRNIYSWCWQILVVLFDNDANTYIMSR